MLDIVEGMDATLPDLQNRDDVYGLVKEFYRRAFADELLGPIFTEIAHMDLDHHMPIMCDFWETVLFRAGLYRRNTLALHLNLNKKVLLTGEHFDRWLSIWVRNVDEHFAGEKAELAKLQARRIAGSIHRRLQGQSGSEFGSIHSRSAYAAMGTGPVRAADAPA
ncbi:group III truncated hemoglobin [Cryobacterium tepidiphilum]|uniref:group III truncated hemoglobin n=1 Tax=Cryobacterium tepidiphilum TaxID=2486026 RepID=UPI0018F2AA5D|nr:group III truncated hemoglobin [Cryobacterium tepidiphilum]